MSRSITQLSGGNDGDLMTGSQREGQSMPEVLETELKTYEQHRDHLLETAEGKFVLIRNDQVIGVYDAKMDAIAQGYQQCGNVPFLVKQILKVEMPQNFTSNLLSI
jgi:hypothetical protein